MTKKGKGGIVAVALMVGVLAYFMLRPKRSGITYAGIPIEDLISEDPTQGAPSVGSHTPSSSGSNSRGSDVDRDLQFRLNDLQSVCQQAAGDMMAIVLIQGNPDLGTDVIAMQRAVDLADLPARAANRLFAPLAEDGIAGTLTRQAYARLRQVILDAGTAQLRNVYCQTIINTTSSAEPRTMNEALAEVQDALMNVFGYPPYNANVGAWQLYLAVGDSWLRALGV